MKSIVFIELCKLVVNEGSLIMWRASEKKMFRNTDTVVEKGSNLDMFSYNGILTWGGKYMGESSGSTSNSLKAGQPLKKTSHPLNSIQLNPHLFFKSSLLASV